MSNNLTVVVVVAVAVVLIIALLFQYLKNACPTVVQIYPACPNIPSAECTDTPTGRCLFDCDQYTNECYDKCDPKDIDCIRKCYDIKANCYMNCLGNSSEVAVGCGCGV